MFTPKRLDGLSPAGQARSVRQQPTLLLEQFNLGREVCVSVALLDDRGKPHYAFKPEFVAPLLNQHKAVWGERSGHAAFQTAAKVRFRDVPHGPNIERTSNGYPVHTLAMKFKANAHFEDVKQKVLDLGGTILEFLRHEEFPAYYLGLMQDTYRSTRMIDQLQKPNHDLWKAIKIAEVNVEKREAMDYKFLDETIEELVPDSIRQVPTANWKAAAVRLLYKSGQLPNSFSAHL